MERLIDSIDGLEIVATYDFAYNIDRPVVVDSGTEDVVYVLSKK